MSTVNVEPSRGAAGSIDYALYGRSGGARDALVASGETRAAVLSGSCTPAEFIERAEAHGRRIQAYNYTQNFDPEEFDPRNPEDLKRVNGLGGRLAQRLNSADYVVVTHADRDHAHNHIYMVNDDQLTGKSLQRNTSWKHGLWQTNDELMRDEQQRVLENPQRALPDWDQRRETFAAAGFERDLGDRIATALRDPRSTDQEQFSAVLSEHDVRFSVAKSGEYRYKSRHPGTGRLMSKSGGKLTPEFTRDGAAPIFEFHQKRAQQKEQQHGNPGRDAERGTGGVRVRDFGEVRGPGGGRERDEPADVANHDGGQQAEPGDRRVGAAPGVDHAAIRNRVRADGKRREQAQRDRADARRLGAERRRLADEQRRQEAAERKRARDNDYGLGR